MSKLITTYPGFEWIDLAQPDQEELQAITQPFDLDINMLADSLQHGHLPKIDKVNHYTFIILRASSANHDDIVTTVAELSNKIAFFINPTKLLTVHRADFDFLKKRFDKNNDSEGLMLEIINEMLLTYEKPLQNQSDKMDEFERDIFLTNGKSMSVEAWYYQKSKARISKKVLLMTQHVLNQIVVKPESNSILQDLKDTTVSYLLQYDEVIEDANTILNSYLSVTTQKSNEVMKLLTIFSAFFLPLTFIAGIYGMNFEYMPELKAPNGYFITLG